MVKLHYVVDVDIKGFFDNVNHSKLKKQMWNMGIQDKNLISIIGEIRIQKSSNGYEVRKLNSIILGSHNYYNKATHININFTDIYFLVLKTLNSRLKKWTTNKQISRFIAP